MLCMTRFLALAHFVWGLILLLLAIWFGTSFFRILPYMSTGSIGTNLPIALMLAVTQGAPLAILGTWTVILGRWIWEEHPNARAALLATHGILLLLGCLVVAFSVYSLYAAGRSAARGGGLMGPIGLFPLAIGACVSGLALWSISAALACLPQSPTDPKPMKHVADQ